MVAHMSEKLIASITHKCPDEEKRKLEAIALSRNLSLSELVRFCCMREIREVEEMINSLQNAFALTTDTRDSFELASPQPMRDVTPRKTTGTKKVHLLEQIDLLAVHTDM